MLAVPKTMLLQVLEKREVRYYVLYYRAEQLPYRIHVVILTILEMHYQAFALIASEDGPPQIKRIRY